MTADPTHIGETRSEQKLSDTWHGRCQVLLCGASVVALRFIVHAGHHRLVYAAVYLTEDCTYSTVVFEVANANGQRDKLVIVDYTMNYSI